MRWLCPPSALLLALLAATTANAAPVQLSMVMDDNLLLYRGPQVADRTLDELVRLGADSVRVSLPWRAIAPRYRDGRRPRSFTQPANPAQYADGAFDPWDHLLRAARRRGLLVLVNVTGGAPLWATGRRDGHVVAFQYRPDPREFRHFVEMLGRRYDGTYRDENQGGGELPRVVLWSVWNEPNQRAYLLPQWQRDPATGTWFPEAAVIYRRLVRAALGGLSATGHTRDVVLLGETAPLGDPGRSEEANIRPLVFLRALLCLDEVPGCAGFASRWPLAVAGYAHHPYSVAAPPERPDPHPGDVRLADRDRLVRLLDAAARAGRLAPRLPIWWTEFGWQTYPPDPIRGVTPSEQSAWLARAERMTRSDPRVVALTQFLLRDDAPRRALPRRSRAYWGTYQSGLRWEDGTAKPAYRAYRLPFTGPARVSAGGTARLWGLVRPAFGPSTVQLQFAAPGEPFADVGEPLEVEGRRPFTVEVTPGRSGRWRFAWPAGGTASAEVPVRMAAGND